MLMAVATATQLLCTIYFLQHKLTHTHTRIYPLDSWLMDKLQWSDTFG